MTEPFYQEIIRRKREGAALEDAEVVDLVAGLGDGRLTDAQAAAFAMAVCWRGLAHRETAVLTRAMADSGTRLDWRGLDRPVVDKHSTGGVGDTVSLVLAPLVAACGAAVPMIAGRGLGHTGGTIDKLEAIPGYDTQPSAETFQRIVREVGCAIAGPTARLAPADRRLYAIRDATATVESVPLIVASILSKKLAAGLDGLVMDVKFGSGAFMTTLERADGLAGSLTRVAEQAGLPTVALITDMDAPLGRAAGNAVEVAEAIRQLTAGRGDARLRAVTERLATEMLLLAGLAETPETAYRQVAAALDDGHAAERFQAMVAAHGGPSDLLERPAAHLAAAPVVREVHPRTAGIVQRVDTRALGRTVVALGGGRRQPADAIDPAVGLTGLRQVGEKAGPEQPLAVVHAADEEAAEAAAASVRAAYVLGEAHTYPLPLVAARVPLPRS